MSQKRKIPHNLVIVFSIVIISAILTWIIPGGRYDRQTVEVGGMKKEVIVSGTFKYVDHVPQTWQVFGALFNGFNKTSSIIVFILMIGGAFWIMNELKAIDVGVYAFLRITRRLERLRFFKFLGVNNIIITLIMILFSIFGAVFGMSEETIAFTIIFVPLAVSMGYDSMVGIGLCYFAAHIGFAGAILNPFTLGIAQGLANVPLYSGMEYRVLCWVIFTVLSIAFILFYANRIKKNPQKSIMYVDDEYWRNRGASDVESVQYSTPRAAWITAGIVLLVQIIYSFVYPVTKMNIGFSVVSGPILPICTVLYALTSYLSLKKSLHFYVLNILGFTILYLIVGVLGYGWYIMEIAALFFAMGIIVGFAAGKSASEITKSFIEGVKDIVSVPLVVGFAGGIIIILEQGQIVDTILYGLSKSLSGAGQLASVSIMYVFQSALNLIITSGSAKAALTIPIMSQFSDVIGLSRQATIIAFQFGAGFTDMIAPTSGVLIGVLGIAKISYGKWLKWILPFLIFIVLIGWLLLIPTVTMKLNGF
jgi:uncharacterized ion transporter superfamily protein YfcC